MVKRRFVTKIKLLRDKFFFSVSFVKLFSVFQKFLSLIFILKCLTKFDLIQFFETCNDTFLYQCSKFDLSDLA